MITTLLLSRHTSIRRSGVAIERDAVGDVALYNLERLSIETGLPRARIAELSNDVLIGLRRIELLAKKGLIS